MASCSNRYVTRNPGDVCKVICNPGYAITENAGVQWTCLNTGTWSNSELSVVCLRKHIPSYIKLY